MIKQFSLAEVESLYLDSIWPIDRILSGVTTLGQSKPGNEEALSILQSSSIPGASPSDCLVWYPGDSLEESYPSAEMQSPAD